MGFFLGENGRLKEWPGNKALSWKLHTVRPHWKTRFMMSLRTRARRRRSTEVGVALISVT